MITTLHWFTNIFSRRLGWASEVIGIAAISGLGAVVENNATGLFAAINGFAWLLYLLWIVVLSVELIRIPYIRQRFNSSIVMVL